MEVIGDIVPPGVINVVTGPGGEIGKALAANPRIAKVAFTGETPMTPAGCAERHSGAGSSATRDDGDRTVCVAEQRVRH